MVFEFKKIISLKKALPLTASFIALPVIIFLKEEIGKAKKYIKLLLLQMESRNVPF